MKKTVLVTGGAGFIGSHLCDHLLEQEYKVIAFDNFQTGRIDNLKKCMQSRDFMIIQGDINDSRDIRLLRKMDIDYIYHYAATVGVQRTLHQPIEVLDDIEGIKNILNLAWEKKVKRIFYSSSSEVYGESVSFPQNEQSTPLNSRLPYAAVKNLNEIYLRVYHQEYSLNYTIFRFFNTYGPRQSPEFVISKFIRLALSNSDLTVYGTGEQTRSFISIHDNTRATTAALSKPKSINLTINIGNPHEISVIKLAQDIIRLTKSKSQIKFCPPLKEGDMPRRIPDINLMHKVLGCTPLVNFSDGLAETIKYHQNL